MHLLQVDRRLTVLFISHELSVVYRYATNVLCLSRARAYFWLSPDSHLICFYRNVDAHVNGTPLRCENIGDHKLCLWSFRGGQMKRVLFRFYAELNDLLPPFGSQKNLVYSFATAASVKDAIE